MLSAEWKINHPSGKRKKEKKYCGVNGRIVGLNHILLLDKWTSKCDINNNNCLYHLYVTNDMIHCVDINSLPSNIQVYKVNKMNDIFIKNLMNGMYQSL